MPINYSKIHKEKELMTLLVETINSNSINKEEGLVSQEDSEAALIYKIYQIVDFFIMVVTLELDNNSNEDKEGEVDIKHSPLVFDQFNQFNRQRSQIIHYHIHYFLKIYEGNIQKNQSKFNQIIIMSGTNLQYNIVNKAIYKPKEGKIDSICQKNRSGFLVLIKDKFQMTLKLKTPAVVLTAEVKNWNSNAIRFVFNSKEGQVGDYYQLFQNSSTTSIISFGHNKQKNHLITKIYIELDNLHGVDERFIGIRYLLLKGQKADKGLTYQGKMIKKLKIHQQQQYQFQQKNSKNKQISKQFTRVTQRQKKKQQFMDVEDMQMKQVLKMSLQHQQKSKQITKRIKKTSKKQQKRIQEPYENHIDQIYSRFDLQQHKDIFANVNQKWIQAQRKVQIQMGVKQHERLSKHISVKHLTGKRIILDTNSQQRRKQLQALAIELGAKVLKQVGDDCILVTQKKASELIDRAIKCKRIAIVKPLYLQQCQKKKAQLDVRNYYIKL